MLFYESLKEGGRGETLIDRSARKQNPYKKAAKSIAKCRYRAIRLTAD